jgi:ABC-2 type transport system permease protein
MTTARLPAQTCLLAGRNLRRLPRSPDQIAGILAQAVMFTLLFNYVFGPAIHVPGGGSYAQYLVPGIMVQVMAFASIGSAAGVAEDMASGVTDRLRSLPIARPAVLAGRTLSDLLLRCLQILVVAGLGLAVGWRTHQGPAAIAAGFALLILFGLAFAWVGIWIGLTAKSVEGASSLGLTWLFPVTFVANTFVPVSGIAGGLRTVADWNPMSAMVAACRQLFGDPASPSSAWPLTHPVIASAAWSLLILAIFATLAARRYQTTSR